MKPFFLLLIGLTLSAHADTRDWRTWRGPNANNVAAAGQTVPVKWDETTNVLWKTPVPGRGHSSPIVVGDQVFLTTADEAAETMLVLAYDRASGQPRWQTEVHRGGFPAEIHKKNTHASPTLACDGERLFAVFFRADGVHLTALDLKGAILWRKRTGDFVSKYPFGFAASPLLYGNTVIVTSEFEKDGYLAAFDKTTGAETWRAPRNRTTSYSSPIVTAMNGRDQLLISGGNKLTSYDPLTGKVLWSGAGCTLATCGTMVWDGDLVFASGGFPNKETIAMRGDGSGAVVWKHPVQCYEQSLLAHAGYVYAISGNGVAYCWRARDGAEMWKERAGSPISASPLLVGEYIYAPIERGLTYVFRATPEKFELVAENQLGDEAFASPVACGNQLFLRVGHLKGEARSEMLYCLGQR